jgi:4-amino-4-deoxy-L-arabinose transferase-like glycosyltransferase
VALASLFAACVVVYGSVWRQGLAPGDFPLQRHLRAAQSGGASSASRVESPPLAAASLRLDAIVFGDRPVGYRLINLLLHVLATWLAFGIAAGIGLPRVAALAAAGLFAVHPLHAGAVATMAGRGALLGGALCCLAFWMYARAHARRAPRTYAIAVLAAGLATLANPVAIVLPVMVMGADALGLSAGRVPRRASVHGFWSDRWIGTCRRALAVAGASLAGALAGSRFAPMSGDRARDGIRYFFDDLLSMLWPVGSIREHSTNAGPMAAIAIAVFAVVAVLAVVAVRSRRSWPELAFGIGTLLAGLVASAAFGIRTGFEGDLYLASLGGALVAATLLWEASRRARDRRRIVFSTAALVMVGVGAARTMARLASWRDDEAPVEEHSSSVVPPREDAGGEARISEHLELRSG